MTTEAGVLNDVIARMEGNRPGRFQEWARTVKHVDSFSDAKLLRALQKVYGDAAYKSLIRHGAIEVIAHDLAGVCGADRARNLLRLKPNNASTQPSEHKSTVQSNSSVKDSPKKKSDGRPPRMSRNIVKLALAVVGLVVVWNVIQEPDAPVAASPISSESEDAESETTRSTSVNSCESYILTKVQISCYDRVSNQSGRISYDSASGAARRQMYSDALSYSPSSQCRGLADSINGLVSAQTGSIMNSLSDSPSSGEVFNACTSAYGDALINYCGGSTGGCIPD